MTTNRNHPHSRPIDAGKVGHLTAALVALLLWLVPVGVKAVGAETDRPNVILISVDTLRADHLGAYGYERDTSPFLDSLARKGVRFDRAISQASWTLPSHLSLLTSRYPHSHGVENDDRRLAPSVTSLAEVLRQSGYSTTAFISWVYLSQKYGLGRGFDRYHELLPPEEQVDDSTHYAINAADFVEKVSRWAKSPPKGPFFLFLHLFDPHIDYEPPPPYDRMFGPAFKGRAFGTFGFLNQYIRGVQGTPADISTEDLARTTALYDGEIRYTDDQLRRLFETLEAQGLLENTIVVFTSDHGEELNEHGSMEGHQWTLYNEVVRVPFVMRFPGNAHAGRVVDTVVQSIDIAPTILSAVGIERPREFQGQDLLPVIEDRPDARPRRYAFSEIKRFNRKWSVRTDRFTLVFTEDTQTNVRGVPIRAGYELFDAVADPREQNNIYEHGSPVARRLRKVLMGWMTGRGSATAFEPAELNQNDVARLKGLGYMDGD